MALIENSRPYITKTEENRLIELSEDFQQYMKYCRLCVEYGQLYITLLL